MTRTPAHNPPAWVARIGADANDIDDVRLQKMLMVGGSLMFIIAGVIWGLLYLAFDEWLAGSIPIAYSVVSCVSVLLFALTGNYRLFRFSQYLLILLLPWLLMIALGGFINSSAVILWALVCPLGALIFDRPRHAPLWFLAYVGLIVASGFFQPYLRATNNLPPTVVLVFFILNLSAVSSIVFVLLYYFVGQKNTFQEKSEALLLNILPKEIATELRDEPHIIARHYPSASVLFADVVNFTPMSAEMTSTALVELLNEVFSYMDTLVGKYGLEKIKTIGDCYMASSGVPRLRPDHAQALARMALEIQAYASTHLFRDRHLIFRIGISSGPVVAGVIGSTKFSYDLWGDAVITASRMAGHGPGATIQITRATYDLIRDEFLCESRGTTAVKGKGDMEIWHVLREIKPAHSEDVPRTV
jgi:guanylate cyclase